MIAISIIVPVYNTMDNLVECLESLCCQTLKDIEIIIVNDGSSDDSQSIIDRYIAKDKRIISLYQDNAGPGEARNAGVIRAQGKYIGFVDSDDTIQNDMYNKMFEIAEITECDIVSCNFVNVYQDGSLSKPIYSIDKNAINIDKYGLGEFLKSDVINYRFGSEVWSKIFKKSLIVDNNIYFKSHKKLLGEDILFLLECLFDTKYIVYINEPLYLHRCRMGSLSNSPKPRMLERFLILVKTYQEIAETKGKSSEIVEVLPYMIYSYIEAAVKNEVHFHEKKECIASAVEDNLVVESMKKIYVSKESSIIKRIVAYMIAKKHLNIFIIIRLFIEKIAKLNTKCKIYIILKLIYSKNNYLI